MTLYFFMLKVSTSYLATYSFCNLPYQSEILLCCTWLQRLYSLWKGKSVSKVKEMQSLSLWYNQYNLSPSSLMNKFSIYKELHRKHGTSSVCLYSNGNCDATQHTLTQCPQQSVWEKSLYLKETYEILNHIFPLCLYYISFHQLSATFCKCFHECMN